MGRLLIPHRLDTRIPSTLALDPGGATGYVFANRGTIAKIGQIEEPNHHLPLWSLLDECNCVSGAGLTIVCEEFDFRKDERNRSKINYISKEYIGVVKLFRDTWPGMRLVMQGAAVAKAFWTDDKLKHVGLYTPGKPHANDAMRHFLWYVSFVLRNDYFILLLRDFNR